MDALPKKAWLVGVDMGYGHQRAAMPLLPIAQEDRILTANNYPGIPESDLKTWSGSEKFYNFISRFKGFPVIGEAAFGVFDRLQAISEFYPRKDEKDPTWQLRLMYREIARGWGRHLVEILLRNPLPLVTTYFAIAHMAEYWNYPAPIFAVVTDSDISRAWAPLDPEHSKINYLASTLRSARRLESYGVNRERIFLTGFPLPKRLMGPKDKIAKEQLRRRIIKLDPEGYFEDQMKGLIRQYVGTVTRPTGRRKEPIVITLTVGGAGAQVEIVEAIVRSLATLVKQKKISLNLVAGVSLDAARRFEKIVKSANLETALGYQVRVVRAENRAEYFRMFDDLLLETDILWTKPSELSFYAGLGIPLILTPPVGAQEIKNKEWLLNMGAAVDGKNPEIAYEWLPDLLESGRLAEAALNGFIKIDRRGAENIMERIFKVKT